MLVKLKKKRLEKNESLETMAKKLGISVTYYNRIENEKRNLYYDMAVRIATILETTPDELFFENFNKKVN